MKQIVLATGNLGKVREVNELLADCDFQVLPQSAFNVPEAEETGLSFVENALIKARNAAAHSGLPAIADDSGLVVDALGGAPGVRSARFAGPHSTDAQNLAKLLAELTHVPPGQRSAHFHCVVVALRAADDPAPEITEGRWYGEIALEPRGRGGFGYDPLFWLPGRRRTSAELDAQEKNRISHRGQALAKLLARLRDEDRA